MATKEEVELKEKEGKSETGKALPYGVTAESLTKLISAVREKQGNEGSIRSAFGKGKYYEAKRVLIQFNIISADLKLTAIGKQLAYEEDNSKKQEIWFSIMEGFQPYSDFLFNYKLNSKPDENTINLENVKNFWGKNDMGNSDSNRNDATFAFAAFTTLSGFGTYIIGRGGSAQSRLEVNRDKLLSLLDKKSIISIDVPDQNELASISPNVTSIVNAGPLQNPYVPSINYRSSFGANVNISVEINMSEWPVEKIQQVMDILKEKQ